MAGKEAFERKLEALRLLKNEPPETAAAQLKKALKDKSNFLVSKAAAVAGELRLTAVAPDLLAAFDRFMTDPVRSDPQCWAKNAIVKTLKDLNHEDPMVFMRGIEHVQMEAVWGGTVDTAATLRGACALALVACSLDRQSILTRLIALLVDELPVRLDAIHALGQVPGADTVLLLRLKALLGDKEPQVTGRCFDALLDIAPSESVEFVAKFLAAKDSDLRAEAAAALAASREPEAIEALRRGYADAAGELKTAILQSLAGARQQAGAEVLLSVAEQGRPAEAALAVKSLAESRFREELRERAEGIVRSRAIPALTQEYEKFFGTLLS